jgi:hypothetical protein
VAGWRLRQTGFGAGRVPLAPVFTPGPFSAGESLAEDLASVTAELEQIDRRMVARRSALALGLTIAVTLLMVALTPAPRERDAPVSELVLIEPEPILEQDIEPEPLVEPEPEPDPSRSSRSRGRSPSRRPALAGRTRW